MEASGMPLVVAKRLGYALKNAQYALRWRMDEVLRPLNLTTPKYAVLSALEAEPGLSNARLARATFVTAQTMQGILANLHREGLIERSPDPDHGRAIRGDLSEHGRSVLAEAHIVIKAVEDEMIASMGERAAVRLTAALVRCARDLRAGKADAATG